VIACLALGRGFALRHLLGGNVVLFIVVVVLVVVLVRFWPVIVRWFEDRRG